MWREVTLGPGEEKNELMDTNPETFPWGGDIWKDVQEMSKGSLGSCGRSIPIGERGTWQVLETRGSEIKCPKGCNGGRKMGLRVKLESETAGHCRGHVKGLGLCLISRESIERCWAWVLWFLCIFRPLVQHSLCKTLFSLYPYHWILLQMSKLTIGYIK